MINLNLVFTRLFLFFIDDDDVIDDGDPSAGRFIEYRFPSAFLKLKQVGAL